MCFLCPGGGLSGFLGLVLRAGSAVALKPLWLQRLFWQRNMTVPVKSVCAETDSWKRDTVYHAVSMHPLGAAMANPTCLVV